MKHKLILRACDELGELSDLFRALEKLDTGTKIESAVVVQTDNDLVYGLVRDLAKGIVLGEDGHGSAVPLRAEKKSRAPAEEAAPTGEQPAVKKKMGRPPKPKSAEWAAVEQRMDDVVRAGLNANPVGANEVAAKFGGRKFAARKVG